MTELVLDGCRSTPLGGYLTALGLVRAVTRLLDDEVTGRWQRQRFVLDTRRCTTVDELADRLHARFEPEAVVSPWNAGSGFAGNGRNPTAERLLREVRDSTDERWAVLREAVAAGDRVVETGRRLGWAGKGPELWDKARKPDVLRLCRNEFPDRAVAWVDAAVALGQDADPAYSRLLGTGGNFGRQDLSVTYLARASVVRTDRRSLRWLRALLTSREDVPYLRDAVGQFDPGRAGGIQSSPNEKSDDKGFVNPWAFLLTIEGALLFATAVVRRHGAGYQRAALPFQVRATAAGYASAATEEGALGELWAPEWGSPATLGEVAHLLGEGRAEWNEHPARSGLDFVRAVATLGVDRGITAFNRNVFVNRLGQNPLAIPAGRVEVRRRGGVRLLAALDGWLDALNRADPPAAVATRVRAVEQAVFTHAARGDTRDLVDVFLAVGRCHEAVARSGVVRDRVRPLVLNEGPALWRALRPACATDTELRLALAWATARDTPEATGETEAEAADEADAEAADETGADVRRPRAVPTMGGLRPLLSPVIGTVGRDWVPRWSDAPQRVSLAGGVARALAEAARRRGFPGEVREVVTEVPAAVRGVRLAWRRGLRPRPADAEAFARDRVDTHRLGDLLAGLLTVDWHRTPDDQLGDGPTIDPAVNLLVPFTSVDPIVVPTDDGERRILPRPGAHWPALLAAGRADEVLADAARRLRIAGLRHVITPTGTRLDGAALAAVLLLRFPENDHKAALRRVAVLSEKSKEKSA
ncbi:type I-G CRISPR-associated protein Cas8g1/Csx17 [Gandjariella thermophila]|uniref:Type I-U CRISPR-associated protein Csx17 n=1 Tax=Gandjariella thermophila TaxID=1931992 RepID=A0A4D4JA03_9PSEU|nr:type I-U CRISPR-associated protein Csx17 [Gandjariella thermophila]GDY31830.1 hypothetical protein GTS_34630 [Gandjariella thermophila]